VDLHAGLRRGTVTDKQIKLLQGFGWCYEKAASLHKKQASTVIDKLASQRCTDKQQALLMRFGENPNVPKDVASRIIDEIKANGWRPRDKSNVYHVPEDEPKVQQDHVVPQTFSAEPAGADDEDGEPDFGTYGW
jgi:hypothetical protein